MKEHFYSDRSIYYRTNDLRPDRTTLVLIHGLSGSSSAWAEFETAWQEEYSVVSMDLRGHGKSLKPFLYKDYELEKIVDDIDALLDHLNVTSYVVLSQSYATLLAVLLLRHRPEGARAAVFLSSVYGIHSMILTRVARAFIHLCALVACMFRYSTNAGGHIDYANFRHAGDWNLRRILHDIPNTSWHVWFYCLDHAYRKDLDTLWGDIRIPTLIVHGRRDTISSIKFAERLGKLLPQSTFVVLENASHVFPLTHFVEANRPISEYLRDLRRTR